MSQPWTSLARAWLELLSSASLFHSRASHTYVEWFVHRCILQHLLPPFQVRPRCCVEVIQNRTLSAESKPMEWAQSTAPLPQTKKGIRSRTFIHFCQKKKATTTAQLLLPNDGYCCWCRCRYMLWLFAKTASANRWNYADWDLVVLRNCWADLGN